MRLLDGMHLYMVVGERNFIEQIRGELALSMACDRVAKLRQSGGCFRIMEPRFCEFGCCLLNQWADYVGTPDRNCEKNGPSLI